MLAGEREPGALLERLDEVDQWVVEKVLSKTQDVVEKSLCGGFAPRESLPFGQREILTEET